MILPEVTQNLLRKANPQSFDLYDCVFIQGGELKFYCEKLREKLISMYLAEHKNLAVFLQHSRNGNLLK